MKKLKFNNEYLKEEQEDDEENTKKKGKGKSEVLNPASSKKFKTLLSKYASLKGASRKKSIPPVSALEKDEDDDESQEDSITDELELDIDEKQLTTFLQTQAQKQEQLKSKSENNLKELHKGKLTDLLMYRVIGGKSDKGTKFTYIKFEAPRLLKDLEKGEKSIDECMLDVVKHIRQYLSTIESFSKKGFITPTDIKESVPELARYLVEEKYLSNVFSVNGKSFIEVYSLL